MTGSTSPDSIALTSAGWHGWLLPPVWAEAEMHWWQEPPVPLAEQFPRGGDDFSLAQVAARSGFRDQGHFTRHLTRLVGVTPKHFR
jgi:AraC-like DNA-binding protein